MRTPFLMQHPKWAYKDRVRTDICEFERLVTNLGLEHETVEEMAKPNGHRHQALKEWVIRNRTRKYVPEGLLIAWGLYVSEDEAISPGGNWK